MLRIAALLGMVMSSASFACAATVRPGLANASALGAIPIADASVHDAVANGRDSCERGLGPGPLRHQFPPCPDAERPAAASNVANFAPSARGTGAGVPSIDLYYSRWRCSSSKNEAGSLTFAHLTPSSSSSYAGSGSESALSAQPQPCAWPL
jgi:hypothetical protein